MTLLQIKEQKQAELDQYCVENAGNNDGVEFIEKDEYAMKLQDEIDKIDDILKEKYMPVIYE